MEEVTKFFCRFFYLVGAHGEKYDIINVGLFAQMEVIMWMQTRFR